LIKGSLPWAQTRWRVLLGGQSAWSRGLLECGLLVSCAEQAGSVDVTVFESLATTCSSSCSNQVVRTMRPTPPLSSFSADIYLGGGDARATVIKTLRWSSASYCTCTNSITQRCTATPERFSTPLFSSPPFPCAHPHGTDNEPNPTPMITQRRSPTNVRRTERLDACAWQEELAQLERLELFGVLRLSAVTRC